jgi:hypothetical protein
MPATMQNNQGKLLDHLFEAKIIKGSFCSFHQVGVGDEELIYNLRTKRKDSFLRPTSGGIEYQRKYLEKYSQELDNKEQIYYKIFDHKNNKFSGVLRLTELDSKTHFNWQSFVVAEDSSPNMPIDAMLMVYRIGFEFLGRKICGPWEVDKEFSKMIKIHKIINMAKIVGDSDKYYLFDVKSSDYSQNINKFLKMNYGALGGLL